MNSTKTQYFDTPKWLPNKAKTQRPKPVDGIKITILGCGTSAGVPLIACNCNTCTSKNPRNQRTRASITIQVDDKIFLIDTSPDLRMQALREKLTWIDAVLYTHPHADHIHGVDDLRSFNFIMARPIDCYGNTWTTTELRNKFDYIFKATQMGGGKPMLNVHNIERPTTIQGIRVVPLPLTHGKMPVLGFRIKNVAYITDCNVIPDKTIKLLSRLDVLVLDCLRPQEHTTHLNVEASLALAKKIGAKRTFLTHMGHELEYKEFSKALPKNIRPAYDGLKIRA